MSEVSINLNSLSAKQQSIVGVPKGTVEQLRELVDAVAEEKVSKKQFFNINYYSAQKIY